MGSASAPLFRVPVSTLQDHPAAQESPLEVRGPLPDENGAFCDDLFVNNVGATPDIPTWASEAERNFVPTDRTSCNNSSLEHLDAEPRELHVSVAPTPAPTPFSRASNPLRPPRRWLDG